MRTKPVSATQVRAYAAKALEFADASVSDLAAGRNIAATSLAIHAGVPGSASGRPARITTRCSTCSARPDPMAPPSNAAWSCG